ncbi:MAG: F-type H+-transporting ATPase subunit a, partial [Gaiellales bacterium]|nr:F-type H+-transporting ATPase subunit a [Gaiellales bacterium]
MIRRLSSLATAAAVALALPAQALAASAPKTDPTKEFLLTPWIKIPKLGPIDLSITKGVFYLVLSTAILLTAALLVARHLRLHPKRLQAFVEIIYDFSESQIGRASLPAKTYTTWFPYLATLFLFIWINNI